MTLVERLSETINPETWAVLGSWDVTQKCYVNYQAYQSSLCVVNLYLPSEFLLETVDIQPVHKPALESQPCKGLYAEVNPISMLSTSRSKVNQTARL